MDWSWLSFHYNLYVIWQDLWKFWILHRGFLQEDETQNLSLQINLFQKHSFLHQLTHNMTKRLFIELGVLYMKTTSSEHVVYINCSEYQYKNEQQFVYTIMYTLCMFWFWNHKTCLYLTWKHVSRILFQFKTWLSKQNLEATMIIQSNDLSMKCKINLLHEKCVNKMKWRRRLFRSKVIIST